MQKLHYVRVDVYIPADSQIDAERVVNAALNPFERIIVDSGLVEQDEAKVIETSPLLIAALQVALPYIPEEGDEDLNAREQVLDALKKAGIQ